MYCSQCGKEVPGDARYCPVCGARQEMGIVPAEKLSGESRFDSEKRKLAHRRGRRLGNFLVTVTALLILFAADGEAPAADYVSRRMDASRFVTQNQREMVICNEKGEICTSELPRQILYSADHSQIAYVDRDQELYYMDGMTPVFVDDRAGAAALSFYGETLAYLRETDGGGQELCVYTVEDRTSERIPVRGCREFCLSPDGRTVACVETEGGGILSVWRTGEAETEITGNVSEILSVSDQGTCVMYRKDSDRLYLSHGKEEKCLASVRGSVNYVLNEAQTEILYTDEEGAWYYSAGQEEPVRLTGVKGAAVTSCYLEDTAYQQRQGLILGKKTLKNMLFATRDRRDHMYHIYHLDGEGNGAKALSGHTDQFQIAGNGHSLIYLSDQRLYRIEDVRYSQEKTCLSDSHPVSGFLADRDLRRVWFTTPDRELYFRGRKECVGLPGEPGSLQGRYMDGILFQEGRELYYADEEKKTLVKEDVDEVSVLENGFVILDTDSRYCYLRDMKDMVDLMGSR